MAELKTKPNDQDVEAFLNSVENEKKRQASYTLKGHRGGSQDVGG